MRMRGRERENKKGGVASFGPARASLIALSLFGGLCFTHVLRLFPSLSHHHPSHGCMGTNFAYYQIKAIWAVLLREFELELVDPVPEPDYDSLVVGPKSGRVRYRRRKLAPAA